MNQPITSKPSSNSPQNAQSDSNGKQSFQISAPSISLPKGGGAIRGMGEKFAANPVTGTGSMSVPIATSPGRSGFGPQLSISYDSGAGNGPFGFGWSLSLPSITRKTDKGLPRYQDVVESDVFILSGAEDLVPVFKTDPTTGKFIKNAEGTFDYDEFSRPVGGESYRIRRYRPRIEGLFARIERWTNTKKPEETFWRSISKDNITTWYGKTENSRIVDTADPDRTRIFSWLICESYDDKGNVIIYRYKEEDSDSVAVIKANERNRTQETRKANRYLKRICYGNREPYLPKLSPTAWPQPPDPIGTNNPPNYFFEVVFDYDDGHYAEDAPDAAGRVFAKPVYKPPTSAKWSARVDPVSTYRAGFEVRTYRLCQRVLMFHHFPDELGTPDYLVRSTDFTYSYEDHPTDARNPIYSFMDSVSQSGYVRQNNGSYLKRSLPPLEFEYTKPEVQAEVHDVDPESLENLPYGLDGSNYQWVDLDGEGLSGILTEQGNAWFYKRNLSPLPVKVNGKEEVNAHFAPLELIAKKPSLAALSGGGQQFLDLAGDGQLDLVALGGPTPGFFERTQDEDWEQFKSFRSLPNVEWNNPNLKFVDLTGDGHADILITEDDVFWWYPSLAEDGFGPAERVPQNWDEEKGPRLVFADAEHSIHLGDLSGDGLSDLVRIRNGEVCYWPNLGYGRFGAKVTMDNSPWFEDPDQFDPRRIQLADIDGSSTTDIIYLGRKGIDLYFNQSGNGWSQPQRLEGYPQTDNLSSVTAMDLLGNGTACLIWSSPLPGNARRPMRYIDLMGGNKPHLLVKTINNLGAETHVEYAPSTEFYVKDKLDGKPWITKIPFPVHVVKRVETYDYISCNRFVTRYAYHHGYFDGVEREFRGFGMVEQRDTEEFTTLSESDAFPDATNIDAASHVPPVLTKTWFHTGVYIEGAQISRHFEDDYYYEGDESEGVSVLTAQQLEAMLVPDTKLPTMLNRQDGFSIPWPLSPAEAREACRSLKGSILRQEIYGLDGNDEEDRPYSASERNYTIELLQPLGENNHVVFFTHPRETIDFHYERKLFAVAGKKVADPRVTHAMTLEVDSYGNVLKSAAIGYGRRHDDPSPLLTAQDREKQKRILITYTENRVTKDHDTGAAVINTADDYRTPLPCESRTYEIIQLPTLSPTSNQAQITNLFRFDEMLDITQAASDGQHDLAYENTTAAGATANKPYRRLIEQVRTLYRNNDLTGSLPFGQLASRGLPFESYKLAFTPELLSHVYKRKRAGQPDEGLLPSGPQLATLFGGRGADQGGYVDLDGNGHWWISSGRLFYDINANVSNPPASAAQELTDALQHFFLPRKFADPFGQVATVDYERDLLVTKTKDALDNIVRAVSDYRVLQPKLITDPNANRTQVVFDALGLVVATAVMGKANEPDGKAKGDLLEASFATDITQSQVDAFMGKPREASANANESVATQIVQDLLGKATTRIIYDLDRFKRSAKPTFAGKLARETHVSDQQHEQRKIQVSISYFDGFGREIQKKIQAEPGSLVKGGAVVNPRWVGSGWIIFNNKGKPVRQYEPFFDDTHAFKFGSEVGVSPILFYDPVERVVATLHPNHTYDKVVFDPWQQTTHDVNDTVTVNAKTDNGVKGFFTRLADADYLPSWHQQRITGGNAEEKDAAMKSAVYANTPTVAYFDALGRVFLTVAHNKFERRRADGTIESGEGKHPTRVNLDIEGNQREVIDAKDRIVMRHDYDVLGNQIHQANMEAGERWMLNDVHGKLIRGWDSRGFLRRFSYDELRRPTELFVTENGAERSAERTIYGEGQGDSRNHLTRVFQVRDAAGVLTNEDYDFKGNLRASRRELLPNYHQAVDWKQNPTANDGTFTTRTEYDALNRPVSVTTPDNSIHRPTFNEANLLDKVDVNLRGTAAATSFVTNIDYNAKGQRTLIHYASGAEMTYEYDEKTFRLTHLKTTRPAGLNGLTAHLFADPTIVQDLHYTYDPVGNITNITDDAISTIYYNNEKIEPIADYVYDAIYRLIYGRGREHIGQTAFDFDPPDGNYRDYPFVGLRVGPNDPQAVRNYGEAYDYDEVGNIKEVRHAWQNGNWTRAYTYDETSLLETGKKNNRLSKTTLGNGINRTEPYTHDAHGNMSLPHLATMIWDFKDQLHEVGLGGGGTAYYVYDSAGQRVRKVINSQNGTKQKERIYFGGFEIYRSYSGADAGLLRETLHIMDDKQRIALVETRNNVDDGSEKQLIRYQFGNHLGSASLELDDQSQVISYEEYMPYGSTSYQAVRSQTETPKRYRSTGKERDEESGFYYHGARYYAPWLGRWTSCDPLGIRSGTNLFAFSRSTPTNQVDKDGLQPTQAQKPGKEEKNITSDSDPFEGVFDLSKIDVTHESGIRFRGLVPKDKESDIRKSIPAIAKQIAADNLLIKNREHRVVDVIILPTTTQFALLRDKPVLLLNPDKDVNAETAAHEMGHAILFSLAKQAESGTKDAATAGNVLGKLTDIFTRAKQTKVVTINGESHPAGTWVVDPSQWSGGKFPDEHPWKNMGEFFASAKAAFQFDRKGFDRAVEKLGASDPSVKELKKDLSALMDLFLSNTTRPSSGRGHPRATPVKQAIKESLDVKHIEHIKTEGFQDLLERALGGRGQ